MSMRNKIGVKLMSVCLATSLCLADSVAAFGDWETLPEEPAVSGWETVQDSQPSGFDAFIPVMQEEAELPAGTDEAQKPAEPEESEEGGEEEEETSSDPGENGFGVVSGTEPTRYENVSEVVLPTSEKDGMVLIGWNTEPDGSGTMYYPGEKFILEEEDSNLYGVWKPVDGAEDSSVADPAMAGTEEAELPAEEASEGSEENSVIELKCAIDSEGKAEKIAELYGISFVRYEDGIAYFTTEKTFEEIEAIADETGLIRLELHVAEEEPEILPEDSEPVAEEPEAEAIEAEEPAEEEIPAEEPAVEETEPETSGEEELEPEGPESEEIEPEVPAVEEEPVAESAAEDIIGEDEEIEPVEEQLPEEDEVVPEEEPVAEESISEPVEEDFTDVVSEESDAEEPVEEQSPEEAFDAPEEENFEESVAEEIPEQSAEEVFDETAMDDEFMQLMIHTSENEPEKYREYLEAMSDTEYAEYISRLGQFVAAMEEEELIVEGDGTIEFIPEELPAEEGFEEFDYVLETYDIDIDQMTDDELVCLLQDMKLNHEEMYLDIIENMNDSQYERYNAILEIYLAEGRFSEVAEIVPFTVDAEGNYLSANEIVLTFDVEDHLVIPEAFLFLVRMKDGTETYIYMDDENLSLRLNEYNDAEFIYKDIHGYDTVCTILTERSEEHTFETEPENGFVKEEQSVWESEPEVNTEGFLIG